MGSNIKGDTTVSEDSLFRLGSFTINGKKIDVPLQAIDLNRQLKSPIKIPAMNIFACEIYRKFAPDTLKKIQSDGIYQGRRDKEVERTLASSGKPSVPSFLFTSFGGQRYPNDNEIRDLINASYPYSDAVPIPALPDIFKRPHTVTKRATGEKVQVVKTKGVTDDQFKEYLSFLEKYIHTVNEWNHKDILGIMPVYIGSQQARALVDFYYGHGVHHFYFDFNTRMFSNMLNSQMMNFITALPKVGLEYQKTFIYAINNSPGKFSRDDDIVAGKDILTPGAGMDCVGKLHIGGGGPNKTPDGRVMEKVARNRLRLFNKEDYGYYQFDSNKLPFQFPTDSSIPSSELGGVPANNDLTLEKIFNMEQLSIETVRMREYIGDKFKPLDYIQKNKNRTEERDIKALRAFRGKIHL